MIVFKDENVSDYVMTIDDPYVEGICRACRKNRIFASPNIYIEENGKKYDMSLLINDEGKIVGRQKMVHIAQCENFYEQTYYEPSEDGFPVFDTKLGRIAIVVCFDRHYPESVRTEALHGAELILIPTANTSAEPSELFQWEIKIQAFQNSVNIAMCNRVGKEGDMEFSGESMNRLLLMPVNAAVTTSLLMCGAVIPVQLNFMKGSDLYRTKSVWRRCCKNSAV